MLLFVVRSINQFSQYKLLSYNMKKVIQVFLVGNSRAELSAELIKLQFKNSCAWVTYKDEDGVSETIFPLTSVAMMRLLDDDEDDI